MPKPVEALPCGSRSTTRTCSPMAAKAVPRLMAVVVFPTPPFWLAIAITRGRPASGRGAGFGKGTTSGWLVGWSDILIFHRVIRGLWVARQVFLRRWRPRTTTIEPAGFVTLGTKEVRILQYLAASVNSVATS